MVSARRFQDSDDRRSSLLCTLMIVFYFCLATIDKPVQSSQQQEGDTRKPERQDERGEQHRSHSSNGWIQKEPDYDHKDSWGECSCSNVSSSTCQGYGQQR